MFENHVGKSFVFPSLDELLPSEARFGRYRIKQHASQSAYFNAYIAYDVREKRDVWLKVLAPAFTQIPELYSYLKRIARQDYIPMQHRNILPLLRVGQQDGNIFIARPYIKGHSAQDHLDQFGSFSALNVKTLLQKILPTLRHMHEKGVPHLNLKPSNIMMDETGDPFLVDAGLTPILDIAVRALVPDAVHLQSIYASPEQLKDKHPGTQSDIYSLGSVTYTLLTGTPPFSATTNTELFEAQFISTVPSVQSLNIDVPDDLAKSIEVALSFSRAGRFDSIAEWTAEVTEAVPITLSLNEMVLPRDDTDAEKMEVAPVGAAVDLAQTPVSEPTVSDTEMWALLEAELTKSVQEYQPIPKRETATLQYQRFVEAVRDGKVTEEIDVTDLEPVAEGLAPISFPTLESAPLTQPDVHQTGSVTAKTLTPVSRPTPVDSLSIRGVPAASKEIEVALPLYRHPLFASISIVCLILIAIVALWSIVPTRNWAMPSSEAFDPSTTPVIADHGPQISAMEMEAISPPSETELETAPEFSLGESAKMVVGAKPDLKPDDAATPVAIPITGSSDTIFIEALTAKIDAHRQSICGADSALSMQSVLGRAASLRNIDMLSRGYWAQTDILANDNMLMVESALVAVSDGNAFLFGGENPDFANNEGEFVIGTENLLLIDGYHDPMNLATITFDAWLAGPQQRSNIESCYWQHVGVDLLESDNCKFLLENGSTVMYDTCTLVTQIYTVNAPSLP